MTEDIDQLRTELLKVMAEAGRLALKFDPLSAAVIAPIPSTDPLQYVVAGTLPMIAKVLPAESSTDWRPYHSALSRCAELLDNMKDGDPITEVPDFLAAYFASQSQAAQPSIEELARYDLMAGRMVTKSLGDYVRFSEVAAHLAGQSQATRAATQAIALFERMLEAEFGKPRWPSVYDVEQCIKMLKGSAAQEVTQQAAPECAMCNDSGIVGFPPDQYESCPECTPQVAKAEPISEHNARFAIDAAIQYGRENRNAPPSTDHWLYEYWNIGRQLARLSETGWDNVTPLAPVTQQAAKAETAEQAAYFRQSSVFGPWIECEPSHPDAVRFAAPTTSTVSAPIPAVVREAVEAAFEDRAGWRTKIAAAVRALDYEAPSCTVSVPEEVRNAVLTEADEAIRDVLWQVENGDGLANEVYGVERCRDAIRSLRTTSGKGEAA